jgi:hypothetical protein
MAALFLFKATPQLYGEPMRVLLTMLLASAVIGTSVSAAEDSQLDNLVQRPGGLTVEGLHYLSYQGGKTSNGADYNEFLIKRGYLTVKKELKSWLGSRITVDVRQDESGDMKVRLKYIYADVKIPNAGPVTKPHLEFGMVPTPWLSFETAINRYRMRDKMYIQRAGVITSSDIGLVVMGNLLGDIDREYREAVNSKYPGRYGSFAVGVYNGGGYSAHENNQNKVVQARLSIRPLPAPVPGLQLSGYYNFGKGNQAGMSDEIDDWETIAGMVSYEHRYLTMTAQYVTGKGNYTGAWSDDSTYGGYSVFGEGKLGQHWRIIGQYDYFDYDIDVEDDAVQRAMGGVAFDFGGGDVLLVDYEVKTHEQEGLDDETRFQVTLQIEY